MTTLIEGNLAFEFPENCAVSRYDGWAFYRNQFNRVGGGSKAVDFVCICGSCAWLIEVKDYRLHPRTKPSELHEEVAIKARDTLAGMAAAQANANKEAEREIARNALSKRWRVALHLEQPKVPSRLRPKIIDAAALMMKLRQAVRSIDAHPKIVDTVDTAAAVPWTAHLRAVAA